ncbi:MAG: TonB-dependent receptor [Leptothrix sp. (in: b-proteobacteria)]
MLTLTGAPSRAQSALEPVVITGTRFADEAQNLPFGVSVITAQEIRRSGANTVNEAIMKLLGVPGRLDLNGGGDYALDLRGFGTTSDNNQVIVVDGIRLSEGDTGGTRLAGIPIDTVERIEVLRGSGTVLYGEGATGGVIVVTTKAGRGSSRADSAELYAGYGSHATRELRAGTTLTAGDLSFDLAANRRLTDGERDNAASGVGGVSLGGQWQGDAGRVALRHAEDRLQARLPGALSAAQFAADPNQTLHPDDHGALLNRRTGLQAEARAGGWELGFDAGVRRKEVRSLTVAGGFPARFDYNIDADQVSVRARRAAELAGLNHRLAVGVDVGHWQRAVSSDFGDSLAHQTNRAVYARDELALASGLRLSAGLRREAVVKAIDTSTQGVDAALTAWEFGLVLPLSTQWQAYARAGRSFRLANADEFTGTAPGATLRPQTSRDLELGSRWVAGGDRFDLRAYRSALTDEIGFDPTASSGFPAFPGANVNFDPTRRQGLEAEGRHAVSPAVELRAAAAWRQSRFVAGPHSGRDVPLVPRRSASVGADWQVVPAHRVGAQLVYSASRYPNFVNSCRLPAVATLDARYAYTLAQAELSLSAANLTDRRYATQAFGCAGNAPTSLYPEPGRALTAAVRLRF